VDGEGKARASLQPELGAPGPLAVGAIAGGVITVSSRQWGTHVRAVSSRQQDARVRSVLVDSGRRLGRLGGGNTAPGGRALGLLLEGDAKEPPCLV
jgi:hypothetical protein